MLLGLLDRHDLGNGATRVVGNLQCNCVSLPSWLYPHDVRLEEPLFYHQRVLSSSPHWGARGALVQRVR
jgi:hypothetical protein